MRRAFPLVFAFVAPLGCGGGPSQGFPTTVGPPVTPMSSGSSSGEASSTSAASGDASSTSAASAEASSTSAAMGSSGEASSTSGTIYDLGTDVDVGPLQPPGCKDKIDFLFVMQRSSQLPSTQAKLIAAFPQFIDTIQDKFVGFDVHIMAVDTDWQWGLKACEDEGCFNTGNNGCKLNNNFAIPDYPCGVYADLMEDACNITLGAGVTFNAGNGAANVPCKIDDQRRFITQDQTDLKGTFACMAKVGQSGGDRVGRAMVEAVSPTLNDEGGCNAGFLRDDALLMITIVAPNGDEVSEGTPQEWAEAVFAAKHGNKDSVIMLGINGDADDPKSARLPYLFTLFPHYRHWFITEPSYGPAFAEAVALVDEACQIFTPG